MGMLNVLVALGALLGAPEQAQAPLYDLFVYTEMHFSNRPGGPNSRSWQPLEVGKPIRRLTESISNNCGFRSGELSGFTPGAAIGWAVDVKTLTSTPEHVIVQVRWVREQESGKRTVKAAEEITVLLRPREELRLDTVQMPTRADHCQNPTATLVVSPVPRESLRTFTSTDLWLVHKLPAGNELTQQLNIRGKFNSSQSFFFDGVRIGQRVIDVFGKVTLRARAGGTIGLELGAERHLIVESDQPDEVTDGFPDAIAGYFGTGVADVNINVGPDSVTSFEIPLGSGPEWAAFKGHSLSLRVKSRRIR